MGWSIGNVLLDFTGGAFSILQMFLLSYNYGELSFTDILGGRDISLYHTKLHEGSSAE